MAVSVKIEDRIKAINANRSWWSMLIYADPGAGKTYLAGTSARKDHDTLIIRPPTDHTDTLAIHFPDVVIDEFVFHDWHDLDEIHEYLRHEDHGKRWVWFDSISLGQDIGLDGIMDDLVAAKPHRDLYIPDRGEYGENMNRMKRYVRLMSALDFNFGMTAHVTRYTFAHTLDEKLMPAVQGKQMPEKIAAMANVVGFLNHDEDEGRTLRVRSNTDIYAKDGFGAFPAVIANPNIQQMEKRVAKAKAKAKKAQAEAAEEDGWSDEDSEW